METQSAVVKTEMSMILNTHSEEREMREEEREEKEWERERERVNLYEWRKGGEHTVGKEWERRKVEMRIVTFCCNNVIA